MGDPLMRVDAVGPAALADAASRLDRALDMLEAALKRPVAAVHRAEEIAPADADRLRELETAAGIASTALGAAMAEVRRLLHEDPDGPDPTPGQDRRQLALESGRGLLDQSGAAPAEPAPDPAPHKEPTA